MHDEAKLDEHARIEETLLEVVEALMREMRSGRPARAPELDSALDRDLGFDSLTRTELIARLERRFDVVLPESVFAEAESPRDLVRAVARAEGRIEAPDTGSESFVRARRVEGAPHSAKTLVEVLQWHVERHPDRTHIRILDGDVEPVELTYDQLWRGASAVATGLQHKEVAPGDTVAIMLPTGRDYFFSFFGVLLCGAVPVPIYPPVRRSQIEEHLKRHGGILRNCAAKVLITVEEARLVGKLLGAQAPSMSDVTTVEEVSRQQEGRHFPRVDAGDIAFIQYTSGSTGNPKGVVLSHANLLANIRAMGESVGASSEDVFVSWLPLYHDMGLIGAWLGSLYFAMPFVVMSPVRFLVRPYRWLEAIDRYRGTLSASPNFGYELCLRRIPDEDLSRLDLGCWRLAFNGAEPVSPATMNRFIDRFGHAGFQPEAMTPVYGLAESSVGLAFPPLGEKPSIDCVDRRIFSSTGRAEPAGEAAASPLCFVDCGVPLAGHEVRVVDPDGRELPERRQGALQFRGPSATSGYYRNPEASAKLFKGTWLDSGDFAYVAGGRIFITGRSKDIVIRGGRNVYPHELEDAVGEIDGVRKGCVAVFGAADAKSGTERLVVVAETKLADPAAREDLAARITTLAADLVGVPPDDTVLAPPHTVLKTSSGKVRRSACRELYERGSLFPSRRRASLAPWFTASRLVLPMLRRAKQKACALAYAGYAWCLFGAFAAISALVVVSLPRLDWRWSAVRTLLRWFAWCALTPLDVRGLENLAPRQTRCIFVSNHMSYLDGYALIAALPRRFSFVAKAEFREKPVLHFFLARLGVEFVERFDMKKRVADARRMAGSAQRGQDLLFFPEGTFTRRPGLLRFRMGAFHAAVASNVPVAPLVIRGTRHVLRADSWFPRRGRISVEVGPLIECEAAGQGGSAQSWNSALSCHDRARAYILAHCGEPDLAGETV